MGTSNQAVVLLLVTLALTACQVSDEEATRLLENEGLTGPQLGGPALWGCPEELSAETREFQASRALTYPDGRVGHVEVGGTICCDWPFGPCVVRQSR